MKKIPSLFKRDYEGTRQVYDEVVPGCEWVLAGEGIATLKLDGTSCLVQDGVLFKRYDAKKGKTPPADWFPCEEAPDQNTGHWPGWLPVSDGPEDRWHREAWEILKEEWTGSVQGQSERGHYKLTQANRVPDGTYELVGPKIQGNPEQHEYHALIRHGAIKFTDVPCIFAGLQEYFATHEIEGIVWHHPDDRMVKIRRKDFGFEWPIKDRK